MGKFQEIFLKFFMDASINPKEALIKIQNGELSVIDVRTKEEYAGGHVTPSFNIDISQPDFSEKISALDKNKEYLVYCRSGGRSSAAQKIMTGLDFKNVRNLTGGIIAWERGGLPIEN